MVDFGHDWRTGNCGDELCPYCEFVDALMDEIRSAADKPEHVWNKVVGELSDRLFDAVWALNRVRREGFTDEHDMIANEQEAANKLVAVYRVLDGFREQFGIDLHGRGDE